MLKKTGQKTNEQYRNTTQNKQTTQTTAKQLALFSRLMTLHQVWRWHYSTTLLNPYEAYDTRTHVSLITTTPLHTGSSTAQLEGQEESRLTTLAD